jgi:antitoxin (DNA-binding transcriptional repressor) of toxin-antitoxin stability system
MKAVLAALDRGEPLTVLHRGREKARLVPIENARSAAKPSSGSSVATIRRGARSIQNDRADALIAATALQLGETLATANVRHFRPLRRIRLKEFRRVSRNPQMRAPPPVAVKPSSGKLPIQLQDLLRQGRVPSVEES